VLIFWTGLVSLHVYEYVGKCSESLSSVRISLVLEKMERSDPLRISSAAKTLSLLLLGVGLIIVVALLWRKPSGPTLKATAILPLTGSAGYVGSAVRAGMETALFEMRAETTKVLPQIELIFEDSMNDPKSGVSSFEKATLRQDLSVVVCAMSSVTKSILPLLSKRSIPLVATVVSSESVAAQSPWAFRFFTRAEVDARVMAEFAFDSLGLRTVGILSVQDDFGISYTSVFRKRFQALGGSIVVEEVFSPGQIDFSSSVAKVKQYAPQAVYILSYANNIASIPRQMRQLGVKSKILSIGTISQSFVVQQAGGSVEGAYYTTNAFNTHQPSTPEMVRFVQNFRLINGKDPEFFEVFGYDVVNLLVYVSETNGVSPTAMRDGLLKVRDFRGAAGAISVSPDGEIDFPIVVCRIEGGKPSKPLLVFDPSKEHSAL
jgi:branched-chain amino acid transport system substrate-binding protein